MKPKHTINEVSPNSKILATHLRDGGKTEYTYQELSSVIGIDVTDGARHNLNTARRILLREDLKNWECLRGYGIKLTDDVTTNKIVGGAFQKIRRVSGKYIKKAACINFDGLDKVQKKHYTTNVSILGTLRHFCAKSKVKTIETAAENLQIKKIPVEATLQLFQNTKL